MFILTDGVYYVMKNPLKEDDYLLTDSPVKATEFTWKQARSITNRKGKKFSKFRDFQILDLESGNKPAKPLSYKGNGGAYIGENDIKIDGNIINSILSEGNAILSLAGWNKTQLSTYEEILKTYQSKYDSAESDIVHALESYEKKHDGKKPQAHKAAQITYLLNDIRSKRRKVKQCLQYVQVMKDAIDSRYSLEKIKLELSKRTFKEYQERTEYFKMALDILE